VTKLVLEVVDLPDVGKLRTGPQITSDERNEIRQRLERQIGKNDSYRMVFDPWQMENSEAIHGCISDDLADIWSDLKRGMLVLKQDDA
jgi:hypothetical protein